MLARVIGGLLAAEEKRRPLVSNLTLMSSPFEKIIIVNILASAASLFGDLISQAMEKTESTCPARNFIDSRCKRTRKSFEQWT